MTYNNFCEKTKYPIKLIKFLTSSGIASRRKSFELILKGRISVNGIIVKEPSMLINSEVKVKFDNKLVTIQKPVYIKLNKPPGYTCTNSDPYADKKAVDLITVPDTRLFSIGRLDKNSEGLILFTNDGVFANRLMHPKNQITKTYFVTLEKELTFRNIIEITEGIIDSGETLKALKVEKIAPAKYKFILNEGKKREIRRLVKRFKNNVVELKRVAIGNLRLQDLPEGKWKYLTPSELNKALKN
ncbi:MAG: rRNA pseudouridine synthase [Victivallales bacterium]|nr:rRNA pseudouridine synthase [Victivallales bacterium]MCF7889379.1 rRNA pseudouridine synthase [Victivallales bacterium]